MQNRVLLKELAKSKKEITVAAIIAMMLSSLAFVALFASNSSEDILNTNNQVSVETSPQVINGDQDKANLNSTVNWQKQVSANNVDQLEEGIIIEEINNDQEYVYDSLDLPDGWSAQWSYDPVGTPEESRTYTSQEPGVNDRPTYIKITTGSKDTFKPSVVEPVTQPISETALDAGKNPSAPVLYKKKIYMIMRAVEAAADPNNLDSSIYTIDCYDLITYSRCNGYPGYFSSDSGAITGNSESQSIQTGTKDLNTAQYFQQIFDDGTYGNEGRLYFPAQKGNEYGIGCVNILQAVNCGFTSLGSSLAPVSGDFPTLISGFVQKGSKFYGHANDEDLDYQRIICFDLNSDGNGGDAPCDGYDETTLSSAPTYILSQHYNKYRRSGAHAISGDKLYWTVDYRYAINSLQSSQSSLRTVMFCFDITTKQRCPGTGGNEGWSHNFGGAPAYPSSALQQDHSSTIFIWRQAGGEDHAVCTVIAIATDLIYYEPAIRCFSLDNGIFYPGGGGSGFPDKIFPSVWWPAYAPFIPWKVGLNHLDTTNESGQAVTYFPLYTTASGNIGEKPVNGATLCYNWETQEPCEDFGNKVRYWFDINDGESGDVGYADDGACIWAVGNENYLWSFDPKKGEFPCRSSQTELSVSANADAYYCDGKNRAFEWDKIRLSKTNLYNFDTLKVTVKNASNDEVIPGYENVDIKDLGYLDISDISYDNVPSLELEVVPTVFNTSPWANGKSPNVSAILRTDNVQYCFQTKPKEICNLKQIVTATGATVTTDTDTITGQSQTKVDAQVGDDKQCYKDVRVSLTRDRAEVKAGDTITYTVKVEHKGKRALEDAVNRGKISNAKVEVTIPSGLEFVSANNGGVRQGNKVVWSSQTFAPEDVALRQVTFRPSSQVTISDKAGIVFAATTQSNIVVQASVISGDDIYQADNTASDSSAILITETSDEQEESTEEELDLPEDEQIVGGGTEFPDPIRPELSSGTAQGGTLTPSFIRNIVPPRFADQAEQFFKVINSAVQPIPNNVAVAIPYASIAFLAAFAVIYIYQALQETRIRRKLIALQQRYKRTEELRKNYVDMTSHYINTPIAKMSATLDLLVSENVLPESTVNSAKTRISKLGQHAKMLLSATDQVPGQNEGTKQILAKKSSFFGAGTLIPLFGVLVVTIIINALFVWTDKYDPTRATIIIQSSFYILSAIALFIAYNRFKAQKFATEATQQEINLEKQLTQSQSSFIANSSKTLEDDLIELSQLSTTIQDIPKSEGFTNGINSLKDAVNKLSYLNSLTSSAIVPTISNQTIKDLAYEVINNLKSYADERNVALDIVVEPGLTILVDIDGFKQILESTIQNAIKFSKSGSNVEVKMKRQNKESIKITVKDSGVGIPKEKIEQLFKPFGRATDSREYNYEGIGLDLYMDKLIAEQCGGSIRIDSEVNKGTTVTIILPS